MEVEAWLKQAKKDYQTAEKNHEIEEYAASAFYFQQSVEKGLKYVLMKQDFGLIKTHDCFNLAKKAGLPGELVAKADIVSPYYVRTRYPDIDLVEIDEQDVKRVRQAAEKILQWIEDNYYNP